MTVSEAHLLSRIYERSTDLPGFVETGPGDDCAVLRTESGRQLVTIDQCVEGRHFAQGESSADRIATVALRRAISDIHAMGGSVTAALAAGAIGPTCPPADTLFEALSRESRALGIPLVGGDIASTNGATVLTVTVLGAAHEGRGPVLRSGAVAGDSVFVTGPLGGSAASGWQSDIPVRGSEAKWLCESLGDDLHAMIDLSDGLGIDGGRIAGALSVRLVLDEHAIPLGEGASIEDAIGGGNDYELLLTASIEAMTPPPGMTIFRMGEVVDGAGCAFRMRDGSVREIAASGWDHQLP